ncbi:hypothetical protein ABZ319_11850 [Nocardia sp. NPDC005978]|uniref:hypothetical protein n=1 Tax=Nocardia sp. NPDC005978 TaxID=3156725 RepID=UPI0033AA94CE
MSGGSGGRTHSGNGKAAILTVPSFAAEVTIGIEPLGEDRLSTPILLRLADMRSRARPVGGDPITHPAR